MTLVSGGNVKKAVGRDLGDLDGVTGAVVNRRTEGGEQGR